MSQDLWGLSEGTYEIAKSDLAFQRNFRDENSS